MLDEYLTDSNFLLFYFKYFITRINGNLLLDYSSHKGLIFNNLKSLNCNVININDYNTGLVDGIVLNNLDRKIDSQLFCNLSSLLKDNGKILIIMHINRENKCFDDESENKYIKELKEYISDTFIIEEELVGDASWKFIIILKNTIK